MKAMSRPSADSPVQAAAAGHRSAVADRRVRARPCTSRLEVLDTALPVVTGVAADAGFIRLVGA
jgi:hypothetical protein